MDRRARRGVSGDVTNRKSMQDEIRRRLAARFLRFADECARQDSPFYERLSNYVASSDELLDLAAEAPREPVPNVFFGAVHYLLLNGSNHPLREYYPSITSEPTADANLFATFLDFCSCSREDLVGQIQSRLVQTNEVNRCAILAPAFSVVSELGNRRPMTLAEVGASAGLNLIWDRYRIGYSDGTVLGDPESAVHVDCENRGVPLSAATASELTIAERFGVDLNPIKLDDADQRFWLRALVWPDHQQRARRLDAAIALALHDAPKLVRGDALAVLPELLANAPRQTTLCVYHSSVLYQFTSEERHQFAALLAEASFERPVWHVSAENEEGLRLFSYGNGALRNEQFLGEFDAHGRWLRWNWTPSL